MLILKPKGRTRNAVLLAQIYVSAVYLSVAYAVISFNKSSKKIEVIITPLQ